MPWCPECRMEYQPGITICPDCKAELVEKLEDAVTLIPFFQADDKKVAEKLLKFFQYSDLDSSMKYDADNDLYIVFVDPKKQMEAKKLYQAFYFVERERMEKGESDIFPSGPRKDAAQEGENAEVDTVGEAQDDEEKISGDLNLDDEVAEDMPEADQETKEVDQETLENDESSDYPVEDGNETPGDDINAFDDEEDTSSYVMKADQYKDLSGTVWIFLIFGIAGLVFVLLNVIGILSVFNGWIANTVMGVLFLFFIYVALSTNQKAKKIQSEVEAENKLTDEINEWLKNNVTEEFLNSISDENVSRELNYLKQNDTIKEMLISEFGSQNLAYLDRLIEEYYTRTFDNITE